MTSTPMGICLTLALLSGPLLAKESPVATAGAASVRSIHYACDDGKKITSVIDESDSDKAKTTVSVEGDSALQGVEMHDVLSANGVKSSNGKLVWWTKGDEGFLAEEDPPHGNGEVLIGGCGIEPGAR